MSWKEWTYELDKANREYDTKIIDKDTYETRVKYAIHMIYEEGETEKAEGIAKAHGYGIKKILAEGPQWGQVLETGDKSSVKRL